MKIIELLNKIANGEEIPNKIKYDNKIYYIDELEHFYTSKESVNTGLFTDIFYKLNDYDSLNEEVEIIEEDKKIEKIEIDNEDRIQALSTGNFVYKVNQPTKNIIYKINEIIDYINKKG